MNEHEKDGLIMDLVYQVCAEKSSIKNRMIIDNKCLSVYEDACAYLEMKGYLKNINGRMYEIMILGRR